jgi:intraflagellar transport protein 80
MVWSPEGEWICYASGNSLYIKPMQSTSKQIEWKAHEGLVLKVDWSGVNGLIVSCGEDCRVKIWDRHGRSLYVSRPWEHVVTCVSWAPSGEYFAAGMFNQVKLCDKTGWAHEREKTTIGSAFSLAWCDDGTQLAVGGNGMVAFGSVIDRKISWGKYEVKQVAAGALTVDDIMVGTQEQLNFSDPIVHMNMAFDRLIVEENFERNFRVNREMEVTFRARFL